MKDISQYVQKTLGTTIDLEALPGQDLSRIPFYMKGLFRFHRLRFLGRNFILAEMVRDQALTITRIRAQLQTIKEAFGTIPILGLSNLSSVLRGRLIEQGINFVVPGKQLFLPDLMIDLREKFRAQTIDKKQELLPSAQVVLLYWLLRRADKMEHFMLKQLALELNYTPTTITNAVAQLLRWNLCEVHGTKEKHIRFGESRPELWQRSVSLMTSPILTTLGLDVLPENILLWKSNITALARYTDIDGGGRQYIALAKRAYAHVRLSASSIIPPDIESPYCLELWKYDPGILTGQPGSHIAVDPLSLYLSLKDSHDERIEKALESLIGNSI